MISVCLATFNGEAYIKEQLCSILNQLSENDELIISDDHSTDQTIQIIKNFDDKRIKIFYNDQEPSVIRNFENSLNKAVGDYIFLSDQDDIWLNNKVERMLDSLQGYDLVVCDCYFVDNDINIIGSSFFEDFHSGKGILKNLLKNTYNGNCMAFRSILLEKVLPFPPQLYELRKMYVYHDIWIGLLANIMFRVKFLPEKLLYFRRHSDNTSPTEIGKKSPNSLKNKLKARYLLCIALFNRLLLLAY